jgi:hypothetical protein
MFHDTGKGFAGKIFQRRYIVFICLLVNLLVVGIIWTAEYFRTCRLFHLQNRQIQDLKSCLDKMQDSTSRVSQRTAGCDIEHTSQELRDDTNENNTKEKKSEENGTKERIP